MVTALAGVARAEGPNDVATATPRPGAASRSGPAAPVDTHLHELADRQVGGHGDDAVDLGRLPVAAGHAGGVDQHLDDRADERVAAAGGDAVLQLAQLGQPLGHQPGVDVAVEPGGVGALLRAVGEEPAQSRSASATKRSSWSWSSSVSPG